MKLRVREHCRRSKMSSTHVDIDLCTLLCCTLTPCHCNTVYEQVSWAPGIGIKKSPFKKLFDEHKGVTYIPWAKMPSSMESLTEGGMIDEASLPPLPTPATGDYHLASV